MLAPQAAPNAAQRLDPEQRRPQRRPEQLGQLPQRLQPDLRPSGPRQVRPLGLLRGLAALVQGPGGDRRPARHAPARSDHRRRQPEDIRAPGPVRHRPGHQRRQRLGPVRHPPRLRSGLDPQAPERLALRPEPGLAPSRPSAGRTRTTASTSPRTPTTRSAATPTATASNTTPRAGDWGGIVFRNFDQAVAGRTDTFPVDGTLTQGPDGQDAVSGADDSLSSLNFANISLRRRGRPATQGTRYDEITLYNSRPAITNDNITGGPRRRGSQAAISGDVDSFREDDIARGPLIRRVTVSQTSINGIWVRRSAQPASPRRPTRSPTRTTPSPWAAFATTPSTPPCPTSSRRCSTSASEDVIDNGGNIRRRHEPALHPARHDGQVRAWGRHPGADGGRAASSSATGPTSRVGTPKRP